MLASVPVMLAVSLTLLTRFQFASTALTVTVKAAPAVRAVGVPLFPAEVPGAAVSPGTNNCSFAKRAGLTRIGGLTLAVVPGWLASEAVTVGLPAVLRVTLKLWLPLASAALVGKVALASLDVIATVSLALTRFQLTSTALTVTVKAVPAVCAA